MPDTQAIMNYKGYSGSVHYNDEDKVYHGKIESIESLITYEGQTVEKLHKSFQEAVDHYLNLSSK